MLSDEELMILGGFYSLNWACKKSALFMWVLPVVVLSEEEQFFLSYADMIFREGCSSSFAERNLRFFCSSFEKEKMRTYQSMLTCIIRLAGLPTGGVRGIWCPKCAHYDFHDYIICPRCAGKHVLSILLHGCTTQGCYAHKCEEKIAGKSEHDAVELLKGLVCHNGSRHSDYEVHTLMLLDFLVIAKRAGVLDKIKASTRSEILLTQQYAAENKLFFPMNCFNAASCFKSWGEDECYEAAMIAHEGVPFPEEMYGAVDSGFNSCCSENSPEISVFDMRTI